jgi:hypothetical protein
MHRAFWLPIVLAAALECT